MKSKPATGWIKPRLGMILTLLLSGCASVSVPAICKGTEGPRDALTIALLADGGPQSTVAGANLIAKLDAGCGG